MSDDPPDDFEQEWQDLTEKEILMGVLTELQQIRLLLQGAESEQDDAQAVFECKRCDTQVVAEDRRSHARSKHKAHPDMDMDLFERVE